MIDPELIIERALKTFAKRIFESVDQSAINGDLGKNKSGDYIEACQNMNTISTLPKYVKPKNIGLMFISMKPEKYFLAAQIDVIQFPDGLGGNDIIAKVNRIT